MKTVLAWLSVLMLIGAQTAAIGQSVPAGSGTKAGADCHCARACCSAAQSTSHESAPAVPAATASFQYQPLAALSLVWQLPAAPVAMPVLSEASPLIAFAAPIYARHCVRLI